MTVVGVVIKSSRDLWPVVALMLLMCFVFTVLGMQLFGAVLNPDLEAYAENTYAFKTRFDTFFWSFVQVGVRRYHVDLSTVVPVSYLCAAVLRVLEKGGSAVRSYQQGRVQVPQ